GDLADRVHALLEVDGQGEKVDVAGLRRHAGRYEDDGFPDSDRRGAVGLGGQPPCLDNQRSAVDIGLVNTRHYSLFPSTLFILLTAGLNSRVICLANLTFVTTEEVLMA